MPEVNSNTVTAEAVQAEASRLIATAAAKHNISVDEIPQDVKDRATAEARALLETRASQASNPSQRCTTRHGNAPNSQRRN
jgi:hypothetical protein